MSDLFEVKVWRNGCKYIVGAPGDFCNKCGHPHEQTAREAKAWPFDGDGDAD
jgi:rRNA maturation endonuclease Nob1